MALPFFYISNYNGEKQLVLEEDTSKHIVQVLRKQKGEMLNLTDGKGHLLTCKIIDADKKHCHVAAEEIRNQKHRPKKISIAISLLKNTNRFEWFLEKATEIGVSEIYPLICERTEKEKFRQDRLQQICISAMLQSQQVWLPVLHEPIAFDDMVTRNFEGYQKFVAHCIETDKQELAQQPIGKSTDRIILIGPEGDFTREEIESALRHNFKATSLGETRLRTETAGVVAATFLCINT